MASLDPVNWVANNQCIIGRRSLCAVEIISVNGTDPIDSSLKNNNLRAGNFEIQNLIEGKTEVGNKVDKPTEIDTNNKYIFV